MKVLVADDDVVWRQLVTASLERNGFEAVQACDGEEADAILRADSAPQVVLLDWMMPKMDGIEVCQRLRARQGNTYTYAIMVTSRTKLEDVIAGLEAGADDYLIKPFNVSELIARARVGVRVVGLHNELLRAYCDAESLFLGAPFGIATLDPENRVHLANPALLAMLGFDSSLPIPDSAFDPAQPNSGMAGIPLQQLFFGMAESPVLDRIVRREPFDGIDTEFRRHDGKIVVLRLTGRPVQRSLPAPVDFEIAAEDVTERLRFEQQHRQLQKMEAIGTLAGGIAHDFNNVLCVIRCYTDLLMHIEPQNEEVHSKVRAISQAAGQAAELTQQLLAFGRRQVLSNEPVDMNELVLDLRAMLDRIIGEDIEMHTDLQPGLGCVTGDRGQLRQVLMNLIVNARDAMPSGGRLTFSTSRVVLQQPLSREQSTVSPGAYMCLKVGDTGCGIDKAIQSRIFEPFFTTKDGRGSGLGLATTYGIVKQSGGHIWVASEGGQGTTFEIWLPLSEEAVAAKDIRPEVAEPEPAGGTVLLVEDEELVRDVARKSLESIGLTVLEAATPAQALELAQAAGPSIDLLLTDIAMPGMRGPDLAVRLRELRPGLKVIFMSGYTVEVALPPFTSDADANFLPKPFTVAGLRRMVTKVIAAPTAESQPLRLPPACAAPKEVRAPGARGSHSA